MNVIIDFTDRPDAWQRLGDQFALEVRVVVWESARALKIPTSALFRRGNDWCVYKAAGDRAVEQQVDVGRRNDLEAAVEAGLADGDLVIVHPSDRIADGTRVVLR